MLEFVHQNAMQGLTEWLALVLAPKGQILPDTVDLDCLEHQMHGGGAKCLAHEYEQGELDPPPWIQLVERQIEKILPERQMADFNSNQFIQRRVNFRICDVSQRFVERQVEQLIEDKRSSQERIRQRRMTCRRRS